MKIFITGGTGLIGSAFIHSLEADYQVTVLTRDPLAGATELTSAQCDITYTTNISELTSFDDYDAVVNLAGEPIAGRRWNQKQKRQIENSRWHITSQLVEKIKNSNTPPAVFISGSAIGFYGRQHQPVTEAFTQAHPEFSHYLCQKWEDIALEAQSDRTRICILRTGIVLSPHGGALQKMLPPFRLGMGGKMGSGKQYMSWIHIEDMINGLHFLLHHHQANGVFNFTAPNAVTNEEFSQTLAKVLHRPCSLPMPTFALKLLLGEMSEILLYGQDVLPARLQQEGFEFQYPHLESALENLLRPET